MALTADSVTAKPTAITKPRTIPSPSVSDPVARASIAVATAVMRYATKVTTNSIGFGR